MKGEGDMHRGIWVGGYNDRSTYYIQFFRGSSGGCVRVLQCGIEVEVKRRAALHMLRLQNHSEVFGQAV